MRILHTFLTVERARTAAREWLDEAPGRILNIPRAVGIEGRNEHWFRVIRDDWHVDRLRGTRFDEIKFYEEMPRALRLFVTAYLQK